MKKTLPHLILLSFFAFHSPAFAQYPSQNITLLAHWDTVITISEPVYNIRYNSVWGWVDPQDNREYAILGSTSGTWFIDVTAPTAPKVRDFVAGPRDSCIWREYKNYQNYLYMVSDDGVNAYNNNNLQIIDMSYLPDSVHVAYNNNSLITRSHTIFIDGNKLYGGYVHYTPSQRYTMAVYSLANPTSPVLLRALDSDFTIPNGNVVHDMFVRNDTVYASGSNEGLFIFKFNSNNTFTLLGSLSNYEAGGAYNHSSALTQDGKTLIFADEVPANLELKSLDVTNFGNLTILDRFRSTSGTIATPHNPYIREGTNSRCIVAYYQDGVQVFDISNPSNVTRTGFFDTAPADCPSCPNPNYSGCWGAYVDLPSGTVLASDMQNGLFVLSANAALGVPEPADEISLGVYPNPFVSTFQLNFSLTASDDITCELTDITGKVVLKKQMNLPAGKTSVTLDGRPWSNGAYLLNVKGENISVTKKIIKNNNQ